MAVQHPESEAKIAAMFNRIAPRYDLLNALLSARQDKRWRQHLASLVPYRPRGKFLDVASGTGDVLVEVHSQHAEYTSFTGVDISAEMLSVAEHKARAKQIVADFRVMSAEALNFVDQSFDCLSIAFGLRNVVQRELALKEFHRVLKAGGSLLILEFFIPKKGPLAWLFQLYFHHILPFIGGLISDKQAYRYLPESVGSFYTPDQLREVLYRLGYTIDSSKNFLFGACRLIKANKL